MRKILLVPLIAFLWTCNDTESGFAPTGAKGKLNEFGESIYVDEECGDIDNPAYAEGFRNAMFRDGAVYQGELWLVDGSHLWKASLPVDPVGSLELELATVTPVSVASFIGHAVAVTAAEGYVAVALVERGVQVFSQGALAQSVILSTGDRTLDVAARDDLLAVALGKDGVAIYDVANAFNPLFLRKIPLPGFATGVEWSASGERKLYVAACNSIAVIDFTNLDEPAPTAAPLSHRNAKDIDAYGDRVFVANNGRGIWFFDEKLSLSMEVGSSDPNFYANAVAASQSYVYLAAGNLELTAFTHPGRSVERLKKDPIGVNVHNGVVFGFGNFRKVGERTVVRAPAVEVTGEDEFRAGYVDWAEPGRPAISKVTDGTYRLSTEFDGVREVFEYAATDGVWRQVPDMAYWWKAGPYSVEVTADNVIRIYEQGVTEPIGEDAVPGFDHPSSRRRIELFVIEVDSDTPAPPAVVVVEYDSGQPTSARNADILDRYPEEIYLPGLVQEGVVFLNSDIMASASVLNCLSDDELSRDIVKSRILVNSHKGDDWSLSWCSRYVDSESWSPIEDPTKFDECSGVQCQRGDALPYFGVVDIVKTEHGIVALVDNRKSNTAEIISLDSSWNETSRWVHFGRPASLEVDGDRVRVWFVDGRSFTFAPAIPYTPLDAIPPIPRSKP